jgi:hypothetical protein
MRELVSADEGNFHPIGWLRTWDEAETAKGNWLCCTC